MALIGNRSVLHKSPGRFLAGTIASGDRSNFNKHGMCRNAYQAYDAKEPTPSGYRPPYCWIMAQADGGMASIGRANGVGGVAPLNMAAGLNAEATIEGSGGFTNAAMGLVMSAVASLGGSCSFTAALGGTISCQATLAGSSTMTAPLGAIVGALAHLAGTGGVCCSDLRADAFMSADIAPATTVAADVIANAVWAATAGGMAGGSMGEAVLAAGGGLVPPTPEEVAAAVWHTDEAQLLVTRLAEAWGRLGLDPSKPLVTGQTSITFGDIVMAMTGDETETTLTRQ